MGEANRLLGYPDDARLLLINADDLGMYQAINDAIALAFRDGMVHSTSLMVPCPGAEWAVHPSLGDAASHAMDPGGWRVRRTDLEFVTSPEARAIIQQEGIELISYRLLQRVWQGTS